MKQELPDGHDSQVIPEENTGINGLDIGIIENALFQLCAYVEQYVFSHCAVKLPLRCRVFRLRF